MSDILHYGRNAEAAGHPDADQLSAFAEQALPAHERELTLRHLAECAHCREIVALSLPDEDELPVVMATPVSAEAPVLRPVLVPSLDPAREKRPWFSGWNIAWTVGMAAAAAALALAFVFHSPDGRHEAQIAKAVEPAPLPAPAAEIPEPEKRAAAPLPAANAGFAPAQPKTDMADARQESKAQAAPQMALNSADSASATGRQNAPAAGRSFSAMTRTQPGAMAAAPAAIRAPLAAPLPTDSLAKRAFARPAAPAPAAAGAALAASAAPQAQAAMKPEASIAPAAGSGQTAEVSVSATPAAEPLQVESSSFAAVISEQQVANSALAAVTLPGGKMALSVASQGSRRVAIDAEHRLFFSQDGGQHWQPVAASWAGQAVRVSSASTGSPQGFRMGLMGHTAGGVKSNSAQGSRPATRSGSAPANTMQPVAGAVIATGMGITGRVTDASGAAIPGATVVAANSATGAPVTMTTDATGRYRFDGLAPGTYAVSAQATGFDRQEFSGIATGTREAAVHNFTLNVGAATQTVTVSADSLSIEAPEPKKKLKPTPLFTMTTDTGERWVSADGQTWSRE
jgi:hypothetical protein